VIVCQNHTDDTDYLINAPTLIVEVLSKSTRAFDHSVKQAKYLQLPSLEYYVLVEQDFCEVSVLIRAEGFIPKYYYLGQEIDLPLLDLSVSVDDIYDGIDNEDKQRYLASR
jgi:Uma2 family endonuclease